MSYHVDDTTDKGYRLTMKALEQEPDSSFYAEMRKLYGSKFSSCACGRQLVLMYRRAENYPHDFASNGPDADRLSYHDTPAGRPCQHGGQWIDKIPGATVQT